MRDLALLIRSIAWPIVTLTAILLFRVQLLGVLSALKAQSETAKCVKRRAFGANFELVNEVSQRFIEQVSKSDGPATESEMDEFKRKVLEYDN
jgi:hypothetical protein